MRPAGCLRLARLNMARLLNWSAALVVIFVTLGLKFFARGMLSVSAVLLGLIVGYIYALMMGMVTVEAIGSSWSRAASFALPEPFKYGFEFSFAAIHRLLL